MSQVDQAAGLRRWAQIESPPVERGADSPIAPSRVLMVLGLANEGAASTRQVSDALQRWHGQGQRWVVDPEAWRLVPVDVENPHLPVLLAQQAHWALWVGADGDGFRRAYRILKRLAQRGGPRRLLLVHPPFASRSGLLNNLQQAAAAFLSFELWIIPTASRTQRVVR